MRTIVLLSGGLDSAVVLASYVEHGHLCMALGFDYGQPHRIELQRAVLIAKYYDVPFELFSWFDIPKVDDVVFAGRNLMFAAMAIGIAQAKNFDRIAVGCNATDWVRFPDCRPAFWRAVEKCAEAYGIQVSTPLLHHTKRDVVSAAMRMKVPIELTWSCYSPQESEPCGRCLACKTRNEALAQCSMAS